MLLLFTDFWRLPKKRLTVVTHRLRRGNGSWFPGHMAVCWLCIARRSSVIRHLHCYEHIFEENSFTVSSLSQEVSLCIVELTYLVMYF